MAAATVVLWHFSIAFPHRTVSWLVITFPTRLLFAGHQAVVLFFVLSGFVLTLPILRGKQPSYPIFLQKRLLRIYVPYFGALLLALAGDLLFHGPTRTGPSWPAIWAGQTWTEPVSGSLLLNHVLLLGNYNWSQINTAFWSLIVELRISLIIPLLATAIVSLRARWSMLLVAVVSAAGHPLAVLCAGWLVLRPKEPIESQTFITLHYLMMFLLGSLLAARLPRVLGWYRRLPRFSFVGLLPAMLLLYDATVPERLVKAHAPHRLLSALFQEQPRDWFITAGALLLIVLALECKPMQSLLNYRPINRLGQISYSLYLVHGTVLFTLMHLLPLETSASYVLALYLPLTLLLAESFFRVVEQPAMHAGKQIGARAGIHRAQHSTRGRMPGLSEVEEDRETSITPPASALSSSARPTPDRSEQPRNAL